MIFIPILASKLYSNIICKNIVKIFQKFEVGYTQTCTPLESSTMWDPKGSHCSVLSPNMDFENEIQNKGGIMLVGKLTQN